MISYGVDAGGDEDGSGDIACVASAFSGLSADEVYTCFEGFGDVFRVADHLNL